MQFMGSLPSNTKPNPRQVGKNNAKFLPYVMVENSRKSPRNHQNLKEREAPDHIPSYVKSMKDILSKKKRLGDYKKVTLTEECNAIFQNKLSPKLKDLRSLRIPCTIGTHFLGRSLCDLGPSINLIPHLIYCMLRLEKAKPTSITLQLASRTLIDIQNGELTMRVQDQQITFNVVKVMKFLNENDECFSDAFAERTYEPN
ncbi:hypothetical protein CDL12_04508 [Handroanthus impetiginosus]|uniref:Uncharacterized protein n=1 Tax=Handroanthus impetiginosus TaxID=429701 RepID=A0A2G9HZ45_9LAMI|nr:hypothetical protein CDL12_04508 [Handroanthus impetiginosus]